MEDRLQLSIKELQETVDSWIKGTGAGYFTPLTNAVILAEETGEVARIMARRYGDQKSKPGDHTELTDLADELADVVWVVSAIANQTGIDLTEAVMNNIAKKNNRDKNRFKGETSQPVKPDRNDYEVVKQPLKNTN